MGNVSGVILLGGGSRRMGRDKASLPFAGESLLQRIVRTVAEVADELVLVRAPDLPRVEVTCGCPLRHVTDPVEDGGPLVGLLAGLEAARHDTVLLVGVDLPLLQPALLRLLVDRLDALRPAGIQWLVPALGDQLEPLCSAFAIEARTSIRTHLDAGERALVALETRIPTARLTEDEWRTVDPEGLSFLDVDTPEQYAAALRAYERLRERGQALD